MRILIVSQEAWDDKNAFGNTVSNLFNGWDQNSIYHLYGREALPNNYVCKNYFRITEIAMLKKFFNPKYLGEYVDTAKDERVSNKKIESEARIINFGRKHIRGLMIIMQECLWVLGKWKNNRLKQFLKEANPDIIFAFAAGRIYLNNISLYCKKYTFAKLVLFSVDDIYSYIDLDPLMLVHRYFTRKNILKTFINADKLYGATPNMCVEYKKIFKKDFEPLYKSCSFDDFSEKKIVKNPIRIVYAGNLYYGREKTLGIIANAIKRINNNEPKIVMEIYTTSLITENIKKLLNNGRTIKIMKALQYKRVKEVLKNADIVLHVESFEKRYIKITRLSLSTKIIDCIQSGSSIMTVGPKETASIQYLMNIPGTIVVNETKLVEKVLEDIIKKPVSILQNAIEIISFARKYHDINVVKDKLYKEFEQLLK